MYTDFLTKIKNAQAARKEYVKISYSNLDFAIAELLVREGYLEAVAKKGRMPKRVIEVKLKYVDKQGAISGLRFLSRPSLKVFSGYRALRKVRQGYGVAVLTTPKGIMTGAEARKAQEGGQLLFEIW